MNKCNRNTPKFYILQTSKTEPKIIDCQVTDCSEYFKHELDISNGDIVLYSENVSLDSSKVYNFNLFRIPYTHKKTIKPSCENRDLLTISEQLFSIYCRIVNKANESICQKFDGVHLLFSIFSFDFCLLYPIDCEKKWNLEEIRDEILGLFTTNQENTTSGKATFEELLFRNIYLDNQIILNHCVLSDRHFVVHNPNFREYMETLYNLREIATDSMDRKLELSLFETLIMKDLVEETHLYWMHESGDLRYELNNRIITKQNRQYFNFFNAFRTQAADTHVYGDWVWSLIFLTQTLLASIKKRSLEYCYNEHEKESHSNFFGFVPIIGDGANEVMSFFTRHISKKFCHGFLSVPKKSIYNLPEYFPAYIHEFFHYVPPINRTTRNKVILDLVLHSVLSEVRQELPKEQFECIFELFKNEINEEILKYQFDIDEFFQCDSMEYTERLGALFKNIDFPYLYNYVKLIISNNENSKSYKALKDYEDSCIEKAENAVGDYIRTFVLFFREIRSDIAMCIFFNIGLKRYIEILANEPEFSILNTNHCADSIILRFGYMCKHLSSLSKQENVSQDDEKDWYTKCIKTINELISDCDSQDVDIIDKYTNLKFYLEEYNKDFIEHKENQYSEQGSSVLEDLITKKCVVEDWEACMLSYTKHPFIQGIKTIYNHYIEKEGLDRLKAICGIKLLFRDLFLFNSAWDKEK